MEAQRRPLTPQPGAGPTRPAPSSGPPVPPPLSPLLHLLRPRVSTHLRACKLSFTLSLTLNFLYLLKQFYVFFLLLLWAFFLSLYLLGFWSISSNLLFTCMFSVTHFYFNSWCIFTELTDLPDCSLYPDPRPRVHGIMSTAAPGPQAHRLPCAQSTCTPHTRTRLPGLQLLKSLSWLLRQPPPLRPQPAPPPDQGPQASARPRPHPHPTSPALPLGIC